MHEHLSEFLDTLSDWVWEMDVNGIHTYSNAAVTKILGYTPEEIVGMHVTEIWPEERATEELVARFNRELKDGTPWQEFRGKFKHKKGHTIILESSGIPLYDENRCLTGYRGVDRDIYETLRKEKELVASRRKYQELSEKYAWENNFKTLLLDIITHDILNPVNIISGLSLQLLQESPDDERHQLVHRSTQRLSTVIQNATTLAKITTGEDIQKFKLDFSRLINETSAGYRPNLESAGISLILDINDGLVVWANPIISEVLKNYLNNAQKYAGSGKQVVIRTSRSGSIIELEVEDEGETIPKSYRDLIFRRGFQADKSAKGSGLGLAIARRIAEAHHGKVGVKPKRPHGNIFYLQLPASHENI